MCREFESTEEYKMFQRSYKLYNVRKCRGARNTHAQ